MRGYLLEVMKSEGRDEVRGRVVFEEKFVGFEGHFPAEGGGAILPGFMQVELALELLERARGWKHLLERVEEGRFLRPVRPGESVDICLHMEGDGGVAAELSTTAGTVSRFRLRVQDRAVGGR